MTTFLSCLLPGTACTACAPAVMNPFQVGWADSCRHLELSFTRSGDGRDVVARTVREFFARVCGWLAWSMSLFVRAHAYGALVACTVGEFVRVG